METPSSTRRLTRSQILATSNTNAINTIPMSRKNGESEKGVSKSRPRTGNQQDRSALIDISNDSPIVGLAIGRSMEKTPLSKTSKKRDNTQAKDPMKTPGSGEALLRGQVKTLLQKVEEEAELSKLSLEHKPLVPNLSDNEGFKNSCLAFVTPPPVQEQLMTSQIVTELLEGMGQEGPVCENNLITRSLLLDFTEKLEGSDSSVCSSELTNIGDGQGKEKSSSSQGKEEKSSMEEDDASIWSVHINASSKDKEEEDEDGIEEIDKEDDDDYYYAEGEEQGDDGESVDELCEWMSNISLREGKLRHRFSGKHTRFVYNADDEIEGEEVCGIEASFAVSAGIVRLNGLPTPEGKHFRFPEEEEEEDN